MLLAKVGDRRCIKNVDGDGIGTDEVAGNIYDYTIMENNAFRSGT
jgi:hypothetical protein